MVENKVVKNNQAHNNFNQKGSDGEKSPLIEKVIKIKRISKTTKGGRTLRFSALVVVGDSKGHYGYASGKKNEASEAIRKALSLASKKMHFIKIDKKNLSIESEVVGRFSSTEVFLRPARLGTGIIAGGPVRAILESAGVVNVVSKIRGARKNKKNILEATHRAILELNKRSAKKEEEMRNGITSINKS